MKKVMIMITLCCSSIVSGQETLLERQAAKTKEKIKQRAENRVEQGIDKTLDKTEEEIESGIKEGKKKKTEKETERNAPVSDKEQSGTNQGGATFEKTNSPSKDTGNQEFKVYSKFDFIPGEKVIAYEDFSQDVVGDFPVRWNTNASGEIVTLENQAGNWFLFANSGIFYPEFIRSLPDNFTLEMDMVASADLSEMQSGLVLFFPEYKSRNLQFDYHFSNAPQAGIDIHPSGEVGMTDIWVIDKSGEKIMSNQALLKQSWKPGEVNRISVWRQKGRLRIYINEMKVWDLPRAFLEDVEYSMLFGTNIWEGKVFISNFRVAEGLPDMRNKLLTIGKVISYGVTFDTNSDRLKPESYTSLREMANLLSENPALKIRIVGHTDSDGDEASNAELSKKRASAVKQALVNEFKIEASRIETDGKGESEPLEPNTTPAGKANNRRVEFIKC